MLARAGLPRDRPAVPAAQLGSRVDPYRGDPYQPSDAPRPSRPALQHMQTPGGVGPRRSAVLCFGLSTSWTWLVERRVIRSNGPWRLMQNPAINPSAGSFAGLLRKFPGAPYQIIDNGFSGR